MTRGPSRGESRPHLRSTHFIGLEFCTFLTLSPKIVYSNVDFKKIDKNLKYTDIGLLYKF